MSFKNSPLHKFARDYICVKILNAKNKIVFTMFKTFLYIQKVF